MRAPKVAGTFYPARPEALREVVERQLAAAQVPHLAGVRALLVPHAGLGYSGGIAAHAYRAPMRQPSTVILVGPDHGGREPVAVSEEDWSTPLGTVACDRSLVRSLVRDHGLPASERAGDHALEVQLPFVQVMWPKAKVVCISMGRQDPVTAKQVADALRSVDRAHLVVASCDLAHEGPSYGRPVGDPDARARMLGDELLKAAETLSGARVLEAVDVLEISSCGHGPLAAVIDGVAPTGAQRLAFGTSNDVEPWDSSVAYGAMAFL